MAVINEMVKDNLMKTCQDIFLLRHFYSYENMFIKYCLYKFI